MSTWDLLGFRSHNNMISLIAAVGKNYELGKDNKLIWHFKKDMEYFKEVTTGKTVVMGRKTYESIGRPLPNRRNIVITSRMLEGVETVKTVDEILDMHEDIFIIGGASIYEEFIKYADKIYLTLIDKEYDADTYFPTFDENQFEKTVIKEETENDIKLTFALYTKIIP